MASLGSAAAPLSVRRLVLPLSATVGVAFGAVLYGYSVLITAGGAGGRFTTSVLSTAFGGSILVGSVVAIPVGRWVDRSGVRPALGVGAVLVAVGFGGFALATEPWHVLLVWWLVIGPGAAMVLFDPAFIALEQWFDPVRRNRAAGTLTVASGLAGPVFVPATAVGIDHIGWRPTAAALGALVAVTGLAAVLALRGAPRPASPTTKARGARTSRSISPVTTSAPFILLTVAVALAFVSLESVQVHRIARFEDVGFSPSLLAGWAALAGLMSLPGRLLVPRVASRFDSAGVLLVVALALVPTLALMIRGTAPWEMVTHFVLFGAVFGAALPMRTVVMGDWFHGPSFGALMGIQAAAIGIGRATGPAAVGWLRDLTGSYAVAMVVVTASMAGCVVALLLAMLARRRTSTDPVVPAPNDPP